MDRLIASHEMHAPSLSEKAMQIAELQGKLCSAHLLAHLEVLQILSHEQIIGYIEQRGYHGAGHQAHQSGK